MSSWPRKIYLLFWVTLIGGTATAAFLLPRLLDSSQQQGYREIDGQGKPPMAEPLASNLSTRFPVRPFTEAAPAGPEREAFPGMTRTPDARATRAPGLPQREVPTGPAKPPREQVTSRARVVVNASVYESPRTTARVLGTVPPDTQVRWVKTAEPGWEEILLRDGRSVYMQSNSLNVGGGAEPVAVERPGNSDGEESDALALLPSTVDSFLETLRQGDLLRASTYLSANAPRLEEPDLGVWGALIGPQADGQMARMEAVSGRGAQARSVLVLDQTNGVQVQTVWEWDFRQERWLLAGWQ